VSRISRASQVGGYGDERFLKGEPSTVAQAALVRCNFLSLPPSLSLHHGHLVSRAKSRVLCQGSNLRFGPQGLEFHGLWLGHISRLSTQSPHCPVGWRGSQGAWCWGKGSCMLREPGDKSRGATFGEKRSVVQAARRPKCGTQGRVERSAILCPSLCASSGACHSPATLRTAVCT
jgi:hypothetical protein